MLCFNKKIFWEYTVSIIYALCIAFVFRSFAFEAYRIPSSSMEPTLLVGDYLFISKYKYGYSKYSMMPGIPGFDDVIEATVGKLIKDRAFFNAPARGDIIVFRGPQNDRKNYIKRLVGLPGDTIVILNGDMYVNGQKVVEEREGTYSFVSGDRLYVLDKYTEFLPDALPHTMIKHPATKAPEFTYATQKFSVPEGHYFFMGDNRDFSNDSRFDIGMVPGKNIIGKAELLFWTSNVVPEFLHLKKDPRWFMRLDK